MADPICRWRNPYLKTVRDLISILPKSIMPSKDARERILLNWGKDDFFQTPYQLACQLGLYYEENNTFYPKFTHNPSLDEVLIYLRSWILNYYVPNPYTKKGFDKKSPSNLISDLCNVLYFSKSDVVWNDVKNEVFLEEIGNDDILINTINEYSDLIMINKNVLKLKEGVNFEDLPNYIFQIDNDRNNKAQFFDSFPLINSKIKVKPIISSPKNTIYYGSPGTGKSYKVDKIIDNIDSKFWKRITFHPEFDYASFVGGYKPISENDAIYYRFVPQAFTKIYIDAWKDLENAYFLVIEEINRGNCAEIFGDIFQLLDRNSNYVVTPSDELLTYLIENLGENHDGVKNGLKLPQNLNILATMNTSDQSLFPMDSAFKRRWDWEYVPICYDEITEEGEINESFNYSIIIDNQSFSWIVFIKSVNAKIKPNPNLGMDKCIGNYFIKASNNTISLKEFINKAIFYLWNDVFKDEEESIFTHVYEDFFPIHTNGKQNVLDIFKSLSIQPKDLENENID